MSNHFPPILRSNRKHRRSRAAGMVPIAHGAYLPKEELKDKTPWEARRTVAQARLLATERPRLRFTGESALVALSGVDTWNSNPDVWVRAADRRGRPTQLPAVKYNGGEVGSVAVRQIRGAPAFDHIGPSFSAPVPIVPPALIAYDLARRGHTAVSLHNVSALLRRLSGFDRWSLEDSRAKATHWKGLFIDEIAALQAPHGRRPPGLEKCLTVVKLSEAGLENPAESVVYWTLLSLLTTGVPTISQHPLVASGRQYFIDIALPDHQVAIEISGFGKFGYTEHSAREVAAKFAQRQQWLTDASWRFINVFYEQTRDLVELRRYLYERLVALGVPVRAQRQPPWEPPTAELFARSRRF